jgi:hypothetical protein
MLKIFIFAYIQILLIATNTINVANGRLLEAMITSLLIGIAWCIGVTGVANGTMKQKLAYCVGGSLGCGSGIIVSSYIGTVL